METNNRFDRRATERARAITKAKAKKQNIIISTVAVALVAVVAASFLAVGALSANTKATAALPASISAKVDKNTNKAVQNAAAQPAAQNVIVQSTDDNNYSYQSDTQQTYAQTTQDTQQNEDRIDNINGERVYIDTKRQAPENTGTPAHYYAYGKTSYGFDWDYDTDNGNFVLSCNYNFDRQQYDFSFYGTEAGTSNITLYYYTDDNTVVPVNMTVTVDNTLNVSLG